MNGVVLHGVFRVFAGLSLLRLALDCKKQQGRDGLDGLIIELNLSKPQSSRAY
jgi:hypothetical protein